MAEKTMRVRLARIGGAAFDATADSGGRLVGGAHEVGRGTKMRGIVTMRWVSCRKTGA